MSNSDPAWHYFVELSLQYYAAGRSAALKQLHRVAPNLLHHAVELILKAALVRSHPLDKLKNDYKHDLKLLWQAATVLNPRLLTPQRDQTIQDLDKFENLRYPDRLINQGATITVALTSGENPRLSGSRPASGPRYQFNLEDVDELWAALFHNARASPQAFLQHLSVEARAAIDAENRHPIQP
jgi:hypothetical protein